MTITAATPTFVQLPGNGSATVFAAPMKCFQASDVQVGFITTAGYALQAGGFAISNIDTNGGFTVTFSVAPPLGTTVDIRTFTPFTQSTEFANLGQFLPENHTEAFDRLTREIQDVYRLSYQFGIHGTDTEATPWPPLPLPINRAGLLLIFDPITGLPTIGAANTQIITTALLAPFLNLGQSQKEANAAVIPTNLQYANGPLRYGALGNGVANDQPAWTQMGAVGGYQFVPDGVYLLSAKVQTSSFTTIVGETRQNTILEAAPFMDYVLEIGATPGGPNPNVGTLENLRFSGGTAQNFAMLHMNSGSHLWCLNKLLFQSNSCPALVLDDIFDSNYTDIDIYNSGFVSQAASVGAAVIIRNGSNNIYMRGFHIEACPSGGIYVGPGCESIFLLTGKIDFGFRTGQSAASVTVAGTALNPGQLSIGAYTITGVLNQFHIATSGSLTLNDVTMIGGSGLPAFIQDTRAWQHLDSTTFTGGVPSANSYGPIIPYMSLSGVKCTRSNASISASTLGLIDSKIPIFRALANLSVLSNGSASGNTITVGTNLTIATNGIYNGLYLVHNSTGTKTLAGNAGSRRQILSSLIGGNLVLAGSAGCTLDADWSIEYCGGHYTPNLAIVGPVLDQGQTIFAVLQSGATISGTPTYAASGTGAAGGATNFTISAAAFPASTDATGYYLVDETTGEPFFITYGVDGSGKIAVAYDRSATGTNSIVTGHTYSVVAGYFLNAVLNGTSYEWTFAGAKKTALVSVLTANGFDLSNIPVWGYG